MSHLVLDSLTPRVLHWSNSLSGSLSSKGATGIFFLHYLMKIALIISCSRDINSVFSMQKILKKFFLLKYFH